MSDKAHDPDFDPNAEHTDRVPGVSTEVRGLLTTSVGTYGTVYSIDLAYGVAGEVEGKRVIILSDRRLTCPAVWDLPDRFQDFVVLEELETGWRLEWLACYANGETWDSCLDRMSRYSFELELSEVEEGDERGWSTDGEQTLEFRSGSGYVDFTIELCDEP